MHVKLDWLDFTFKISEEEQKAGSIYLWEKFCRAFPEFGLTKYDYLPLVVGEDDQKRDFPDSDFYLTGKKLKWYNRVLQCGDDFFIMIHTERPQLGVHCSFPGHALGRLVEIFHLDYDVRDFARSSSLFKLLELRCASIKRIDICFDDFEKRITPHDFIRYWANKQISSAFTKFNFFASKQQKGGTFYIGRRGYGRYMRIYDKNYESKGQIDSIRYEMEFRNDYAQYIAENISNGKFQGFASILTEFITLKCPFNWSKSDTESQISDKKYIAPILPEWTEFLEYVAECEFSDMQELELSQPEAYINKREVSSSFAKSLNWVQNQVLPTLFQIACALGEDTLINMIRQQAILVDESRLKKSINLIFDSFNYRALIDSIYDSEEVHSLIPSGGIMTQLDNQITSIVVDLIYNCRDELFDSLS